MRAGVTRDFDQKKMGGEPVVYAPGRRVQHGLHRRPGAGSKGAKGAESPGDDDKWCKLHHQ